MATFGVKIKRIEVEPHPNADRLEIAKIDGYQCIVAKDSYRTGDLVAYIPEQSLVPTEVQRVIGVEGKLAGSDKNRVKPVRLRGTLSQGLVFPLERKMSGWLLDIEDFGVRRVVREGEDVTELLRIEKYEPPIPIHMAGEVWNAMGLTPKYDIENWKNYPDILQNDEEVVYTEKLHGTWCCVGIVPEPKANEDSGRFVISSKGLSAKGLAFKMNEQNKDNLYVRTARENGILEKLEEYVTGKYHENGYVYILGEIFGQGVQDLHYGLTKPSFRVFDVLCGAPRWGDHSFYMNDDELDRFCEEIEIPRVPVLYRGPFSVGSMIKYMNGTDTLSESHVREGIVMRPVRERYCDEIGRVQLKAVSESYLDRKNGTEYN